MARNGEEGFFTLWFFRRLTVLLHVSLMYDVLGNFGTLEVLAFVADQEK